MRIWSTPIGWKTKRYSPGVRCSRGNAGSPSWSSVTWPLSRQVNDTEEICTRYDKLLQVVVDAGACPARPTTVIDLTADEPVIVRVGGGDPVSLGLMIEEG